MKPLAFFLFLAGCFVSCASTKAVKDLNGGDPDNAARGNPLNTAKAREYLLSVLAEPEGREVKAYERRAYSPRTKKNLFVRHGFYVFLKDGKAEHTLVFTATPKGSAHNGAWMLDARSDVESYDEFLHGGNAWELVEYRGPKGAGLDVRATTRRVLERLDEGRTFFGAAGVRDLPWYHHAWMILVPPPVLTWAPMMIAGIGKDSCLSAVLETMVFE